jgi:hypothetical protein
MKLRTEIEAAPQGGVVWQVLCDQGPIGAGRAFDATAALAAADTVISDWHARCAVVQGSLMEFAGQPISEELVIKMSGRLRGLLALFHELA